MALTQKFPDIVRRRGKNLSVFISGNPGLRGNGILMEEALQRADNAGLVIASNNRLSNVLIGSDKWRDIVRAFPCWSGTMTAYEEPNKKVGKLIEYTDSITGIAYTFPVPEEHRGKKNIILIVEHPNFSLVKEGNERIVQAAQIDALERFPASNGWYIGNPRHDIPRGPKSGRFYQDARFLWRMEKRVGLVVRDNYNPVYDSFGKAIYLNAPPSNELGVAVEWGSMSADAAAMLVEQMKVK
jgi:hypothetical protein